MLNGRMYVFLHRGTKETLEKDNEILKKFQLVVELPEEFKGKSKKELYGKKCKYKMGDGIHTYKELPYEDGLIPVAFYV